MKQTDTSFPTLKLKNIPPKSIEEAVGKALGELISPMENYQSVKVRITKIDFVNERGKLKLSMTVETAIDSELQAKNMKDEAERILGNLRKHE